MNTPVTPEFFIQSGVDAATATELARQHNQLAGVAHPPVGNSLPPTGTEPRSFTPPVPNNPRAQAQLSARAAELMMDNKCDEATARAVAAGEMAYASASGVDRSVMLAEMEAGATQAQIIAAIDSQPPARGPHDFVMPGHDGSEEAIAQSTALANGMFSAGMTPEEGKHLALSVAETDRLTKGASPQQAESFIAEQKAILQREFGADYDLEMRRIVDVFSRFDIADAIAGNPLKYSSWKTVIQLSNFARSIQRREKA